MKNVWLYKQNENSLFGKKYLKPNEKQFPSQNYLILIVLTQNENYNIRKKKLLLDTVSIEYLILSNPHIWKPLAISFLLHCEECLVTDGTTKIHCQRYLMECIVPSYLVAVAALFVCFASPIMRLPKASEWEQSPAKEKCQHQSCNSHGQKALCKSWFLFYSTHAKCSFPEVRLLLMLKNDKVPWGVHISNCCQT